MQLKLPIQQVHEAQVGQKSNANPFGFSTTTVHAEGRSHLTLSECPPAHPSIEKYEPASESLRSITCVHVHDCIAVSNAYSYL